MSVTQRLICGLEVHKPVCNLCVMTVCTTICKERDKLHVEQWEELLHEVQRLFTFCATANANT